MTSLNQHTEEAHFVLCPPISRLIYEVDRLYGFVFHFYNVVCEAMLGILHTIRQGVCTHLLQNHLLLENKKIL